MLAHRTGRPAGPCRFTQHVTPTYRADELGGQCSAIAARALYTAHTVTEMTRIIERQCPPIATRRDTYATDRHRHRRGRPHSRGSAARDPHADRTSCRLPPHHQRRGLPDTGCLPRRMERSRRRLENRRDGKAGAGKIRHRRTFRRAVLRGHDVRFPCPHAVVGIRSPRDRKRIRVPLRHSTSGSRHTL